MKRWFIRISALAVLMLLAPLLYVALFLGTHGLLGPCGEETIAEALSPDGQARANMFTRDCGATTAISTHIQISYTDVSNDPESVFVAEGVSAGKLTWSAPSKLQVWFDQPAVFEVFFRVVTFNRIEISYPGFDDFLREHD